MKRTVVLNVVGLPPALLRHAPNLSALASQGGSRPLRTMTPAVTATVQSTFVTGTLPREHGCVANGWSNWNPIWIYCRSCSTATGTGATTSARGWFWPGTRSMGRTPTSTALCAS